MRPAADHPVVLFDGVCNLCNAAVHFIIDHDREGLFRFAALQSAEGEQVLTDAGATQPLPDSVVLVDAEGVWVESDAALRIARCLGYPWKAVWATRIVPRMLRDALYRLVARHRYRLFGRRDACRIPTPELRARFLSS